MHDIRTILDDPQQFMMRMGVRAPDREVIDQLIDLEENRKQLTRQFDELKREQNQVSAAFAKASQQEKLELQQRGAALNTAGTQLKAELKLCEEAIQQRLLVIPNLPHTDVPVGVDHTANVVRRTWGEPAVGQPQHPHWEIGRNLGLDLERGAQIAGARHYLLRGSLGLLEMAIMNFMVSLHTAVHGYEFFWLGPLANREAMLGCGQLPKFENDLFKTTDGQYLIPTAESVLASVHAGEIIDLTDGARKYVAYSECFRREAGAAGRDTRGIKRVHNFRKVELFKFTRPEDSYQELESLTADAEAVLQQLQLPYRVAALCSGDLGFGAAKTYDLEVWLPSQQAYCEISSCSNVEAFQARRTNTRFRPAPGARPEYVHMLNGSGLAIGRTMIAILENYQQADGSVVVPTALRPFLGGIEVLEPQQCPVIQEQLVTN